MLGVLGVLGALGVGCWALGVGWCLAAIRAESTQTIRIFDGTVIYLVHDPLIFPYRYWRERRSSRSYSRPYLGGLP